MSHYTHTDILTPWAPVGAKNVYLIWEFWEGILTISPQAAANSNKYLKMLKSVLFCFFNFGQVQVQGSHKDHWAEIIWPDLTDDFVSSPAGSVSCRLLRQISTF